MADDLVIDGQGADLVVDRTSPDLVTTAGEIELLVDPAPAPATVTFAAVGLPGLDGTGGRFAAIAAAAMPRGWPVVVDRATGKIVGADASWKPLAFVAGLAEDAAADGFPLSIATAELAVDDWSDVTGSAQLMPGQPYFLAAGGGLTAEPPEAPNALSFVGKAISASTMLINPQPPIQL